MSTACLGPYRQEQHADLRDHAPLVVTAVVAVD